jgi:hypothetical protein
VVEAENIAHGTFHLVQKDVLPKFVRFFPFPLLSLPFAVKG